MEKNDNTEQSAQQEVPMRLFAGAAGDRQPSVDMNQVVGSSDILFVCLDTLRYDVAVEEEEAGTTPVLNA